MENTPEPIEIPETEDKKISSRKFVIWITWLIMAVLTFVVFAITIFITKSIPESLVEILKLVLKYLFVISCEYMGVNLIQKGIFAYKDIAGKSE